MNEGVLKADLNNYFDLFQHSLEFGSDCHKFPIAAEFLKKSGLPFKYVPLQAN